MDSRPLRILRIDEVYLVSNRCFQGQPFLPTGPDSAKLIQGAVGNFAEKYGVELFAYSFLPRGFWMLLAAPSIRLSDFMRDFQSWLAKWANKQIGRTGYFFHGRYQCEAILDAQMMVDQLVEVMSAPVREGCAESVEDYEGAHSFEAFQEDENDLGMWIDRTRLSSLRRSNPDLAAREVARRYPVELASPPVAILANPGDDLRPWLCEQVRERCEAIRQWRATKKAEVLRQLETYSPWKDEQRSPLAPLGPPRYRCKQVCQTHSPKMEERYKKYRKQITDSYRCQMRRWRRDPEHGFPPGTLPPGWRLPRFVEARHPEFRALAV